MLTYSMRIWLCDLQQRRLRRRLVPCAVAVNFISVKSSVEMPCSCHYSPDVLRNQGG